MYKDFNVILASLVIIIQSFIICYPFTDDNFTNELCVFVSVMVIFMLWLDGRISALIDEIRDKRDK